MAKNRKSEQRTKEKSTGQKKPVGLKVALIGLVGTILLATVTYFAAISPVRIIISATQTAEAKATQVRLTEVANFTNTSIYTPNSVLGIEPPISTDYLVYDNFDGGSKKWAFPVGSPYSCGLKSIDGTWRFECNQDEFTMVPSDSSVMFPHGIEVAFYTLPIPDGENDAGMFQISLHFGSNCFSPEHIYSISFRSNELAYLDRNAREEILQNPPVPFRSTNAFEPHTIKIELQYNLIVSYFDNVKIHDDLHLADTTIACWMFMSTNNGITIANGYRGMVLLWIATKP